MKVIEKQLWMIIMTIQTQPEVLLEGLKPYVGTENG